MYLLALCKLVHTLFCVGYWWLLVWVLFTLALGSIVKSREVGVSVLQHHIIKIIPVDIAHYMYHLSNISVCFDMVLLLDR